MRAGRLITGFVLGACTLTAAGLAIGHAPSTAYAPVIATLIGFGLGVGAERSVTCG